MTREDLITTIRLFLDARYIGNDHKEDAEKLLEEYEQKIRAELYEKTRNAIMKSWDSAVIGLGQKRRGQLNAMFTILIDNIEYIFKY